MKMRKMIHRITCPTALVLSCMLALTGFATNTVARDSGISANEAGDTNRAKVVSRLEKVGYSKGEAIARVDKMTDDEIDYFSQHPESIKRSGFIILASLIGSSVWTTVANAKKKRESYITHLNGKIAGFRSEIMIADNRKTSESLLLVQEQDPAKRTEREAAIKRLENEVQSKQDLVKSLENEIESIRTKKQKVPKEFTTPKKEPAPKDVKGKGK